VNVRAIVVINPGNPTGQVLSKQNIKEIIEICHEHHVLIMADEVYQKNVYAEGSKFHSFRKIAQEMGEPFSSTVELFSLHSVSKGLLGECGLRGGYMEAFNIDPEVCSEIYKLKSIELCSNTVGQLTTALMVDPPTKDKESSATVSQYENEVGEIYSELKKKAELLTKKFN